MSKENQQKLNELIYSIRTCEGFDENRFKQFVETETESSISLNSAKPIKLPFTLNSKVPWTENSYYFQSNKRVSLLPEWHMGAFYVQESSSMFIEYIFSYLNKLKNIESVLDVCAAPGGKSLLASKALQNKALIVSNEIMPKRMQVLTENIAKFGTDNFIISNNRTETFRKLNFCFDTVLIDAPCSGSGMCRKDETALLQWSEKLVSDCANRQKKIIEDVIHLVSNDGFLIYSTCSFSTEEDEEICDFIVEKFGAVSISLEIENSWGITETVSPKFKSIGYRFWPYQTKGEGFFVAVFQIQSDKFDKKKIQNTKFINSNIDLSKYIRKNDKVEIINNNFYSIPEKFYGFFMTLNPVLNIRFAGTEMGMIKGKEFIPSAALALTSTINHLPFPVSEIDETTSLKFLAKENINIPDLSEGWNLLTYKNYGLGFVKKIQNRINNYWPKEWRLRNSN